MKGPRKRAPFNKLSFTQRGTCCDILILTGSVGSGHISVAKAVSEALYRANDRKLRVEIVDIFSVLKSIVTRATKSFYLGSLKVSPKIWEFLFQESDDSEWPLAVLNTLSSPFMEERFLALLKEKEPKLLVSTYPIWDLLTKKVWKQYSHGKLPFVSIITDSMSVHPCWTQGDPDYFVVANEDTKVALCKLGVSEKRVKVFGYPVAHKFLKRASHGEFQQKWNLSPKRKTLLLILSAGVRWGKVKELAKTMRASKIKNLQLVIIAAESARWKEKLERMEWPWPTRITGWTNEIHTFIHGADIILTKAGGATVMECIASGKPMMIIEAIPGQEMGNAMLVQKYNVGVVLNRDFKDLDEGITYLLNNAALMKKNLEALYRPDAAEETAKFLEKLVRK